MIPYVELCDAIDRWRARMTGDPADAPPPAPAFEAPVEAAGAGGDDQGVMPETIAPENTNEIDIDSVDVVES